MGPFVPVRSMRSGGGGNPDAQAASFPPMLGPALALCLTLALSAAPSPETQRRYQRAVGLLQHIAGEYPEAIEDGELNTVRAQAEVIRSAAESLRGADAAGKRYAQELEALAAKMPDERAAAKTQRALEALVPRLTQAGKLVTHPPAAPDLARGQALYRSSCAACHGTPEDPQPRVTQYMFPMPSSFLRADVMAGLSPFKAFNVISHGIPGSTMPGFDLLPDEDRWAIAFSLFTQRQPRCDGAAPKLALPALATATDGELISRYGVEKLGCLRDLRPEKK